MPTLLRCILVFLGVVCIVAAALAFIARDQWWIAIFEYLRQQITLVTVLVLVVSGVVLPRNRIRVQIYLALLALAGVYQLYVLMPYTPLYPRAVAQVTPVYAPVRLLVSNVQMANQQVDRYLALVQAENPDVVLVIELDTWWRRYLGPLREAYPYHVERPHDNAYGMGLYSRLPWRNTVVHHFENASTPSIYAELPFPGGAWVAFYGLHPRPPLPENSVELADKELLQVARRVRTAKSPAIVAGDFNDVPWSYTVEKFQKISGLRDLRVGRSFYNTFHVGRPLLRYPIDHIYISDALDLVDFKRLSPFGSDHFALLATLTVSPPTRVDRTQ